MEKNLKNEKKQENNSRLDKNSKVDLQSFLMLTVLGKGSYAKVLLVKKKDTKQIMALKVQKKEKVKKIKQLEHVYNERNILIQMKHPFIMKLYHTFQNERKIFFAMEYCPGGELFNLLCKRKKLTEQQYKKFFFSLLYYKKELNFMQLK